MDFSKAGVLLIDKPFQWTSFDVVGKIRWAMTYHYGKKTKIGHAGTLDPLATGLLILCTGSETKNIHLFQGAEKEYTGTFFMGATRPSFDRETEVDATFPTDHITKDVLEKAAQQLTGTLQQTPPAHSAKWINGKRAYELARAGKEVDMKTSEVTVSEFEITRVELPMVDFRIVCSKGTYIRSMAKDLGALVNSGAYLHELRRTRIGSHSISNAYSIESVLELFPTRFDRNTLKANQK